MPPQPLGFWATSMWHYTNLSTPLKWREHAAGPTSQWVKSLLWSPKARVWTPGTHVKGQAWWHTPGILALQRTERDGPLKPKDPWCLTAHCPSRISELQVQLETLKRMGEATWSHVNREREKEYAWTPRVIVENGRLIVPHLIALQPRLFALSWV